MGNFVKTSKIEFYTNEYFDNLLNEEYSDEKFEKMYNAHPSKMNDFQIKAMGRDVVRDSLFHEWVDRHYFDLYCAISQSSNSVCKQMLEVIKNLFPNIKIKMYDGKAQHYGEKLKYGYLIVSDDNDDENSIKITPTLSDKDNCYFTLEINTPYLDGATRHCNDDEVIDFITDFVNFSKNHTIPTSTFGKVVNWVENQYDIECGNISLRMYDVEVILLYHTLAKEANALFGTDFEYSSKVINNLYKKKIFGNIHYAGKFYLKTWAYKVNYDLEYKYYYDNKGHANLESITDYGTYTKEDIILLLNTLRPYVLNNYFAEMSKKEFDKHYAVNDRLGIHYTEKPSYFEDLIFVKDN